MDLAALAQGTKLLLEDGSLVEVTAPSLDGKAVRVRYLDSPFSPELAGTEGDCTDYEIATITSDGQQDTAVRFT